MSSTHVAKMTKIQAVQLSQNYLYPTIVKCTSLEEDGVFRSYVNACHLKQVVLYTYEVYFADRSVAVYPHIA